MAEKPNQITAIPAVAGTAGVDRGAGHTIDARGCQRAMAEASRAQGADYLLALKRTDNGPANRATIRHAALNLMRAIPEKASLNGKRKTAAGDENYLFNALTARYQ